MRAFLVLALLAAAGPSEGSSMSYAVQPAPAEVVIAVGNRGAGKSTWVRRYTERVRRLVAWDPQRDHEHLGHGRYSPDELEQVVPYLQRPGVVRVAVEPTHWEQDELEDDFESTCRSVWRIGAVCFVTEETSDVASAGYMPGWYHRLVAQGRHRSVSLVAVAQRFAQLPVLARTNATRIVAYRQGHDDVDALVARIDAPELASQIRNLEPYWFVDWTPEEGARIRAPLAL